VNPEIKAKWVAALRSGDYKQGHFQLRKNNEFCCLGVLCNLHAIAHPEIAAKETDPRSYMGCDGFLPAAVTKWAGRDTGSEKITIDGHEAQLVTHNDTFKHTFDQIADAIEEQL